MWTDDDGPLPLPAGAVGVEYRGRLGHPSSYGLLAARLTPAAPEPLVVVDPQLGHQLTAVPRVPGEQVTLGLSLEYRDAITAIAERADVKLSVATAAEGLVGSSIVVFTRLTAVLIAVLSTETLSDEYVWREWDDAWPW